MDSEILKQLQNNLYIKEPDQESGIIPLGQYKDDKGKTYAYWMDDLDRIWRQWIDLDKDIPAGPKQIVALAENGIIKEVKNDRKERGENMQKRQTLGIYVTPDEYKKIAHAAAWCGLSVSRYCKDIILDYIDHLDDPLYSRP